MITIADFFLVNGCRRGEYWLVFVCAALFLADGFAATAKPAETNTTGIANQTIENSKKQNALEDLSETSGHLVELAKSNTKDWPWSIIRDTKESFLRPDNLSILLLAGGASVALHSSGADEKVADNFEDHHSFHGFTDEALNVVGHPWTQFGAAALWYAVSKKNQDDFNADRARAMVTALSVSGIATLSFKAIRHNDSPNGKDWAWPSGHAASSFTVASMLDEYYGPNVGIPAYIAASLISYRMMDTGDHWSSDIVFGAAIGWVVGHTFAAKQTQLEVASFKILPYTACVPATNDTVMGIHLVKQF
ncbi:MAG: phosphatase PAP2 family protein [Phycisphaerae bacterium]|nr:phosphatase PAP2 family protein [Phycisphaerae bacterium]